MNILAYVYEVEDEMVNIYSLHFENDKFYLKYLKKYYLSILGDMTITKLIGKGFINIDEVYDMCNDVIKIKSKKHN